MENISPSLTLLLDVRAALDSGFSVRTGIIQFLQTKQTSFHPTIALWFAKLDHQQDIQELLRPLHPCRRALLLILEKGLNGIPVQNALIELEKEIVASCELEMETQIQTMPIKLLIPLLFFMFPAYLILLFGPLIEIFLKNF